MSVILSSTVLLGGIGVAGACLLYAVAKRFYVKEDPRIAEVEALLPGANCGACGYNGCHDFATACCCAESLNGMACPGAGQAAMDKIASIVGLVAEVTTPKVAVLKCNGCVGNVESHTFYDGVPSCLLLSSVAGTVTGCNYGCLGEGDCVNACRFGALRINNETKLPEIDQEKCTGCSECVKKCPRHIIELRNKDPRGLRVWVNCSNHDKGALAMKVCKVACIGCGKCVKTCPHDAIIIENNLAYIDFNKCKLCRKCVEVCPKGAIATANFPVKKTVNNPCE